LRDPLSIDCTAVPANSAFVVVLDSTRGLMNPQTSVATGGAGLVPGLYRSRWAGASVRYTALCTTQNMTVLEQIKTGMAGTVADWETQGAAGSQTVTAGTTLTREWKPLGHDFRLVVQAGATAPATSVLQVTVTWGEDVGS
jgi:hypothetical protein